MFIASFFTKTKISLTLMLLSAFLIGCTKTPPHPIAQQINQDMVRIDSGNFSYNANESENYRRNFASQSIIMSDIGLRLVKDVKK
ncbi:hypothetical protein CIK00_16520 [Photobacterium carnosum]|uniref:Uncharacterized protein n=1 Tax=Photobacterium carnosum TaxID=2023717 RepID=A0A2N4UP65_9GAMM|nr:hypothetical protein CIK00_16520 [Photobacterium carnosum]